MRAPESALYLGGWVSEAACARCVSVCLSVCVPGLCQTTGETRESRAAVGPSTMAVGRYRCKPVRMKSHKSQVGRSIDQQKEADEATSQFRQYYL